MRAPTSPIADAVPERIRAAGARATPARIRVLRLLSEAQRALSHQEIETRLGKLAGDRVTLYRVLDWLVQSGLAHKVTDDARVFRYSIAGEAVLRHTEHGHFRCDGCGRVFCLEALRSSKPRVPRGFRVARVDVSVRGQCANCVRTHP